MINKSSIFLTVSLIFLTALISTLFSFIFYVKYDLDVYKERQEHKYYKITKNVIPQFGFCTNYDEFSKQLLEFNLVPITDKKIAYEVLQNSTIVLKKITPFGSIFLVEFKNRYFIYIQSATGNFLYQDEEYQFYRYYLLGVIFLFIELILIFGYVLLIKRLKPLKNLRDELIKFADGDLSAKIEINQNDEIGDVANAFSYLTKRVNELLNSRTLFLRNIMHEIKTPITKGKIVAEMVDDEKNRDRLISVFERLENIVSEFATVEKLTSGFYVTDLKPYKLKDILDEAIDLTFANKDNIKFDIENLELIADFRLFSIAIKNLIDNGIKYSTDKQINIICNKEKIIFENRGSKLQHDLKYYLEPYTKEGTKSEGFGLGLYIVDFILKIHNYKLSYTHEDDKSKFIIDIINF